MCTEHGNEKTCSLNIWEFPDWLRKLILQNPGSESHCDSCGEIDRHNEANTGLRSFFPNLHIRSG